MANLSNISKITTERTNTPDVMTPILEIVAERGTKLHIAGMVSRGEAPGVPIYMDLRDGSNNPLPADTEVTIWFESPTMDEPVSVSVPLENIRAYNDLTIQQQQNEEYVDRVKHRFKNTESALERGEKPVLKLRHEDTGYIAIDSSTQIDWSNSRIEVENEAVTISG